MAEPGMTYMEAYGVCPKCDSGQGPFENPEPTRRTGEIVNASCDNCGNVGITLSTKQAALELLN